MRGIPDKKKIFLFSIEKENMSASGAPTTAKEALSNVNVTAALDVEGNVPLESVQIDGLVCCHYELI